MFYRSVMGAAVVVSLTGSASGAGQASTPEKELAAAIRATISGGFTYLIRPSAAIPDSMPRERLALAGIPVIGAYAGGMYHAGDGTYEIYRRDDDIAVRTSRGWLTLAQFTSPLRQEVAQAFDDKDGRLWKRGNVTAGRKALNQLIQISHLAQRTNVAQLSKASLAFTSLRTRIEGKGTWYEGDLTDAAAFDLLQGPFAELVERGTLSLRGVSGVGRVFVQAGLVRKLAFKAAGQFTYYEESDNTQKRGACSLEVAADLVKHGDTRVDPPAEVAKLFERNAK